ncbi:DNA polymerase IV [Desulfosarcina ovata subsp. sediminis]|uniref:DNA polymerase IV n=1 Tax=Desulfosarcina ovata subsp. sediminis TaxID=885957 RepID=A0A5K7ZZD9_9BACT|nr:DNA polymerase IV [Desulfosarcina ovata]BBO85470.1 DNA polymerase IV [Desulfosarcina ovata subsp. sediminis]
MIMHIDMDAFFAAVEQLDHPELAGKVLVVGGASGRGVVAAASYAARRYGIHSAMPMFMAKQRCPHLTIVPPRKARYGEVSRAVMAILHRYSPVVEQVSIDEAYLDAAGCGRLFGPPETMARLIKSEIRNQVSLTCSIGVAPLKFLAKVASDLNKPDGLTVIPPEWVTGLIGSLPVEKVPGVGRQALGQLNRLGIVHLGDVCRYAPALLVERLGKFGHRLVDLAHGRDDTHVIAHAPAKSISSERTLPADTQHRDRLRQHLLAQSQDVGRQLRRQGYLARTITLKLKQSDFKQITRSTTLEHPSQSSETIFRTGVGLLDRQPLGTPIRLIGIGASTLIADTTPQQVSLFETADPTAKGWETVDRVVDRIADRFGQSAVHRGSLQPPDDMAMD